MQDSNPVLFELSRFLWPKINHKFNLDVSLRLLVKCIFNTIFPIYFQVRLKTLGKDVPLF